MISSFVFNLIFSLIFGLSFGNTPLITNHEALVISPKDGVLDAPWDDQAAKRAAVLSADGNFFLFSRQADEVQPIASISKLMTALVFVELGPDWEEIYEIGPEDSVAGGRVNLFLGEKLSLKDLFLTSLIASDNGAAKALVNASGLSEEEFVARMNDRARRLGLSRTRFVDPIGLSTGNLSTAREVAFLAREAWLVPEIRAASASQTYEFTTLNGREKKIESTDYLLFLEEIEVLGGKTGYTEEAGYCYVGYLRSPEGRAVISVVLGASGRNERFQVSRDLANWAFNSYDWQGRPISKEKR